MLEHVFPQSEIPSEFLSSIKIIGFPGIRLESVHSWICVWVSPCQTDVQNLALKVGLGHFSMLGHIGAGRQYPYFLSSKNPLLNITQHPILANS